MLTAREKAAPGDPSRAPTRCLSRERASKSVRGWILSEFLTPKSHIQKSIFFGIRKKSTKMVESIDPWAPKLRFWHQKAAFWHQFWHRLFNFFPKWRKCEISEEYNAKRGSEPSKTFDFRIDFS